MSETSETPDVSQWTRMGDVSAIPATTLADPGHGSVGATGSSVAVLRPVGVGQRFLSGLIDIAFLTLSGFAYIQVVGSGAPTGELATGTSISMRFNGREVTGGGIWLYALLGLLYFFGTELLMGGSVGKRLLGQRVVMDDGAKLTVGAAALRTLLRPIDGFPWVIPNFLGFIVVTMNRKHRRIGDFLARTVVVKDRRRQGPS